MTRATTSLNSVLHGIKAAWDEESVERRPEWQERWPAIFACLESLAARVQHADPHPPSTSRLIPTREWIISLVADFLLATTKDDSRLYPDAFIPRGWEIVRSLLRASDRVSKMGDDPVHQAINCPAGRVIEAMFSHALRLIRRADREGRDHREWRELAGSILEEELRACQDAQFRDVNGIRACILPSFSISTGCGPTLGCRPCFRSPIGTALPPQSPVLRTPQIPGRYTNS